MTLITDPQALAALCDRLRAEPVVTVDTEFLRDKTYWPKLCLVQVAGAEEAVCIDPLADGMDLAPLFALMDDPNVLKVFHAARQDLEIFYNLTGRIPAPLFDSQVAAMVCGFGESAGYETLATKLAKARIDKSQRFTDWSRRPLTDKQLAYALSDVTHLRVVHAKLAATLAETGRAHWVEEEMAALTDASVYTTKPEDAWRRLKARTKSARFLAVLREIAAWREREAQTRDLPRNRVVRDESLLEIAAQMPDDPKALERTRGLGKGLAHGVMGVGLLEAVARGKALPREECPEPPQRKDVPQGLGPIMDLLKVLLKMRCEENEVAQKLIATTDDLEKLAADDDAPVMALRGWRREVFGDDALRLKRGELALAIAADGKSVEAVSR